MDMMNKPISGHIAEYEGHKIYYKDFQNRVDQLIQRNTNYLNYLPSEERAQKLNEEFNKIAQREIKENNFNNWDTVVERIPSLKKERLYQNWQRLENNDSYGMADKIFEARKEYFDFVRKHNL